MRTAPLAGKCALITGSVRGLGLAAAQRLAGHAAVDVIAARRRIADAVIETGRYIF